MDVRVGAAHKEKLHNTLVFVGFYETLHRGSWIDVAQL